LSGGLGLRASKEELVACVLACLRSGCLRGSVSGSVCVLLSGYRSVSVCKSRRLWVCVRLLFFCLVCRGALPQTCFAPPCRAPPPSFAGASNRRGRRRRPPSSRSSPGAALACNRASLALSFRLRLYSSSGSHSPFLSTSFFLPLSRPHSFQLFSASFQPLFSSFQPLFSSFQPLFSLFSALFRASRPAPCLPEEGRGLSRPSSRV